MKNLCTIKGKGNNRYYFLNNLIQYQNIWYCEILDLELMPIRDNVQMVEFESINFIDYNCKENKEKKQWLIKCATENKKISPSFREEQIKKIKNYLQIV